MNIRIELSRTDGFSDGDRSHSYEFVAPLTEEGLAAAPKKKLPTIKLVVPPDFWVSRILPEGIIERWLVPDGTIVKSNVPVAELRIEGELLKFLAPAPGKLAVGAKTNSIVEPGSIIGHIFPV